MKNKVLVEILVPSIEEKYDVYLPINKKIGNITILLCRAINEFTNGVYLGDTTVCLYNDVTGEKYNNIYNTSSEYNEYIDNNYTIENASQFPHLEKPEAFCEAFNVLLQYDYNDK